jgi:hypothetical protein
VCERERERDRERERERERGRQRERETERERGRGRTKDRGRYSTLLYSTLCHPTLPFFPFFSFPSLTSENDRSPARFEVKIISPRTTLERTLDPPDSRVTVSVPEKHVLSKEDVDDFTGDWRGIELLGDWVGDKVGYWVKFLVFVALEGREDG